MTISVREFKENITWVGGLPIYAVKREEFACEFLKDLVSNQKRDKLPKISASANGHVLALAELKPEFRTLLMQADHIDADGMPLVIASHLISRRPLPDRIATTDFIHDIAKKASERRIRFFLLGSTEQENLAAQARLQHLYPNLILSGHHGYFGEDDDANIVDRINAFQTDLLWVGLGVPREHEFALKNREKLHGVTWIKTCGGLFNFLSGSRKRAPLVLQKLGLEWAWRALQEPGRLGPRYLSTNHEALRLMWRYRERP